MHITQSDKGGRDSARDPGPHSWLSWPGGLTFDMGVMNDGFQLGSHRSKLVASWKLVAPWKFQGDGNFPE